MHRTTSRALRAGWGLVAGLGLAGPAAAACPYDADSLVGDIVDTEDALRADDAARARAGAQSLEAGIACLDEVLPYPMVGRVYRTIGAGWYVGGSPERAEGWLLTALEVDPGFSWGVEDVPVGHTLRDTYSGLRPEAEADPISVDGAVFAEGTWFLDGLMLARPQATQGRPHLLQRTDGGMQTWVVDGSTFPAEVLVTSDALAVVEPEPEKPGIGDPRWVDAARAPEKTPLLIGGVATLLGSGGLYAFSMQARRGFEDAGTVEEMDHAVKRTNSLVIASSAVFAVGAGAVGWGVSLPGGEKGRPTSASLGRRW